MTSLAHFGTPTLALRLLALTAFASASPTAAAMDPSRGGWRFADRSSLSPSPDPSQFADGPRGEGFASRYTSHGRAGANAFVAFGSFGPPLPRDP